MAHRGVSPSATSTFRPPSRTCADASAPWRKPASGRAAIDALKSVDPALVDSVEDSELDLEDSLAARLPGLDVVAGRAQDILDLLDEVAAALNISS